MKISNNFTIQDIHNIRYENYEITKNLAPEELINITKKHADEFKKTFKLKGSMLRPKAVEVKALNDYKIFVIFNNGEKKVFDLKNKLQHPFYANLVDEEIFKSVHVNGYTVEWDGEIDICPDELYYDCISHDDAV